MARVHRNSKLQRPVRTKLSVCEIVNLKLCFVNIVILMSTKILKLRFNKTGNKEDNEK
jgi:hypothetical protein